MKITCGVSQGSCLGPKVFIIYKNYICKVSLLFKLVLFADDTNILCSSVDLLQILWMINKEIHIIKQWFDWNKLSLNLDKTKFMLFGKTKQKHSRKYNCWYDIERFNSIQFWGVIFDHEIYWKPKMKCVPGKLAQSLAILRQTTYILSRKALQTLYCTPFLPYVTYCVEVWGNTYESNLKTIKVMQKMGN